MPFSSDGLTVEHFTESGWDTLIASCESRDCSNYVGCFAQRADEAAKKSDSIMANLFGLLSAITSMGMQEDNAAEPFIPMIIMNGSRSAIPTDFDDGTLTYLEAILPHANDAELRARIADILWFRRRDFRNAQVATNAYLEAAICFENQEWPLAISRLKRAIELAARIKYLDFSQFCR